MASVVIEKGKIMKRIVIAGLMGSLVLIVWMVVVNGLLGFSSRINMKQVNNERQVYEALKENVSQPGRYTVNPEPTGEGRYPEDDPVFSILYSGMGHGTAGGQTIAGLVMLILVPMTGAWLLAQASDKVLSSYPKKVFYFFVLGLLIALFSGFDKYGIDGYPLKDALMLGLHDIVLWTLVGFVIARKIRAGGRYSMA
jgi:hypothetical protein